MSFSRHLCCGKYNYSPADLTDMSVNLTWKSMVSIAPWATIHTNSWNVRIDHRMASQTVITICLGMPGVWTVFYALNAGSTLGTWHYIHAANRYDLGWQWRGKWTSSPCLCFPITLKTMWPPRWRKNHETCEITRGKWPTMTPSFFIAMAFTSCLLPCSCSTISCSPIRGVQTSL